MCRCPGCNRCIAAAAALTAVCSLLIPAGPANYFVPWVEISLSQVSQDFSLYGVSASFPGQDDKFTSYGDLCKGDSKTDALESLCSKVWPSTIFIALAWVLTMAASISACMQGRRGSPERRRCALASFGLSLASFVFALVGLAVFASIKGDVDEAVKLPNASVKYHAGFFLGLLTVVLLLVAAALDFIGARQLRAQQAVASAAPKEVVEKNAEDAAEKPADKNATADAEDEPMTTI